MMKRWLAGTVAALTCGAAVADDGWRWDLRVRGEHVDDAVFERDARAGTARLRAGYLWRPAHAWSVFAEGEFVGAFSDRYDSTVNGRTAYPVVADPTGSELNQVWARWERENLALTAGRQRLMFGNQRFVGNVGWRQNEQTFDALHGRAGLPGGAVFEYAYLDRVHRVTGVERDHRTHLLNVSPMNGLTAYAYFIDDLDHVPDSSATVGARWSGRRGTWRWAVEAARQRDHGGQPFEYRADYLLVEPSWTPGRVTWTAGWERLGGDGVKGFSTPLATLHGFNGWADRFTITPPGGLDDRYLGAAGPLGRGRWTLVHHDYSADFGREWNASYARSFGARYASSWLVKYADYRGGDAAPDVKKLWLQVEWRTR